MRASIRIIRESRCCACSLAQTGALSICARTSHRIAQALDDLTRSRVLRLADADFAEYIKLTLPFAAAAGTPVAAVKPGAIGRLMQFGFLYRRGGHQVRDRASRRLAMVASPGTPAPARALSPAGAGRRSRQRAACCAGRVDVNAPAIQPVAYHYLRASIEALGARDRPMLDDFAIAVSCLNAACALAVMNAHASGRAIDRDGVQRCADGECRPVARRRSRIAWLGVAAAGGRSGGAERLSAPPTLILSLFVIRHSSFQKRKPCRDLHRPRIVRLRGDTAEVGVAVRRAAQRLIPRVVEHVDHVEAYRDPARCRRCEMSLFSAMSVELRHGE